MGYVATAEMKRKERTGETLPRYNSEHGHQDFLVVHWLRIRAPNAGGLGSTLGGTRSHMPQIRSKILLGLNYNLA